jgi:RNA polymerase sigma factor (sigma-70 family)
VGFAFQHHDAEAPAPGLPGSAAAGPLGPRARRVPPAPPDPYGDLPVLVQRVRPALARILHGQRVPPWDADDLIQQALLAAIRRWPTIVDRERWLHGTLHWMCVVYWRRRLGAPLVATDPAWLEELPAPALPLARRDQRLDLALAWRGLPRHESRLLYLRYRLGMTLTEAAAALDSCVSTVLRRERRAIARLQALARTGPSPAAGAPAGARHQLRPARPSAPA